MDCPRAWQYVFKQARVASNLILDHQQLVGNGFPRSYKQWKKKKMLGAMLECYHILQITPHTHTKKFIFEDNVRLFNVKIKRVIKSKILLANVRSPMLVKISLHDNQSKSKEHFSKSCMNK